MSPLTTRFLFATLFKLSPDAIVLTGSDGLIRTANEKAVEIFGYPLNELTGRPVEMLVPERFRGQHPQHRQKFMEHPRTRQMGAERNLFGLRKDGTEFPVDIMLKPLKTATEFVVLSFVRDATDQRNAQEALRVQDQQLRSILESVHDYAIYLLDAEGAVVTWSRGAERIKGYESEQIIGKHFSIFFTDEERERGRPAELLRIAAQRGRAEDQSWRVRKDGTRFWAESVLTAIRDSAGRVTGFAKVVRDYTDRKRAEEEMMLQLSQALLATMDFGKLLAAISATVGEMIPHDCAAITMYDSANDCLIAHFLAQGDRDIYGEVKLPVDGSPSGLAFRTREPLVVERLLEAGFIPESIEPLLKMELQSGCWVPLSNRGDVIGTLMVSSRTAGRFKEEDAQVLLHIARQVALAVNNAIALRRISEMRDRLKQEKQYLEEEINRERQFEDIVGESAGLRRVLGEIEKVAPTDATVLIQGETGTGKELLARAIHRLSPRRERTFVKINCAAIPAGLIESELFGHEKGAFTGAINRKIGRLELAHEGTLFLDEVGELPLDLQPKLLRALQEREIERVGGSKPIPVNVRLIAATNRDLARMVADKQFRSDLYYRLRVFPVFAPPLRERTGDIPSLVRHFVSNHSRRMGKSIETIPEETMDALVRWSWPGNIRELENFLERAVILTRGPALYVPLAELKNPDSAELEEADEVENPTLREAEREHILRVLREAKGQIGGPNGAAARLGLKRTTLNSKLKKLGIERDEFEK